LFDEQETLMTEYVVRVQNVSGFTSLINAGPHTVVVDRGVERGGSGLGFSGGELLLASQGGCFASTFLDAAATRGIEVRGLNVTMTGVTEGSPSRFVSIHLDADIDADAPDSEVQKLIAIAERGCTVTNTLRAGIEVEVSRVGSLAAAD
jgi:putative redox protein